MDQQSNKTHRKESKRTPAKKKLHSQGFNAKAFAVSGPGKLQRMAKRSHDLKEKTFHVPMVDRTPEDDPPPVIIAVVGPPGTGKTTLIRSLVRRLTKHTLTEIKGPITVVSGKRRRLTFIEVANDMNSMIDAAKIADLVLLMVDGNFGLEMETMEFLNIAQHHGMPRVLGVTTHLDLFKSQSTLRTSKKKLKHRFWTEVYQGAKLFYLSGVINGRYPDREILNLTRFISVMKFRPLKWRNEHPYLLADRVTDLTHPALIEKNNKIDRKVAIYGYLHGTPLSATDARVHIAGVGDFTVSSIEKLPDPCPTPYFEQRLEDLEREKQKEAEKNGEVVAKTTRRRKRLDDKQKIIYAPMSDVGGVLVDKDAVYIDVGESSFVPGEEKGFGEKLVTGLQAVDKTIDEKFQDGPGVQIFSSSKELTGVDNEENADEDEEDEEDEEEQENTGRAHMRNPRVYGRPLDEEEEADSEEEEDGFDDENEDSRRKLVEIDFDNDKIAANYDFESASELDEDDQEDDWRASASKLRGNFKKKWDISKLIYMNNIEPADVIRRWKQEDDEEEEEEDIEAEEDFFTKKTDFKAGSVSEDLDTYVPKYESVDVLKQRWSSEHLNTIKSRFLTSARKIIAGGDGDGDDDEELYGDFEDLEAEGESKAENQSDDGSSGSSDEDNDDDGDDEDGDDFTNFDKEEQNDEELEEEEEEEEEAFDPSLSLEERRSLNAKKKEKLRLQFEAEEGGKFDEEPLNEEETWYEMQKAKMAKQLEINKNEFEKMDLNTRIKIEGYKAGSYVRLVFENVTPEFIDNFDPKYPLVIGGLLANEERFGYMNARIRRHRWHKKILKSNDPLILSLGWRRFQTLPIYTTSDSRTRTRMLKYTPEHAYCNATFYGPLVAPNTTFCAVQVVANSDTTGSFRISATGIIEEIDSTTEIVKKLKLVGYPYKIFRNTAFIKDMFSSSLEVARFEGAQIKTVSGIRGEIKRALSKPEGHFRATFEDKILISDIVILRTWYPVTVKKFYNPVSSHLISNQEEWKGMRLTGQIRAANNIELKNDSNSLYKKVERVERHFNGLKVPKSIKQDLPFKSQIHEMKPGKKQSYMSKRAVVLKGEDKKARTVLQNLSTISKAKEEKRQATKDDKRKEKLKKLAKIEEVRQDKLRERKREFFQKEGKKRPNNGSDNNSSNKRRR